MPFKPFFCLLFLCFALSGCFELVEEVNVHKNGSGTFHFEANLSQSKIKLDALLGIDSIHGFKVPGKQEIIAEFTKAHYLLAHSPGITAVTEKKDFDNYIFSIGFEFASIEDLNKALMSLRKSYERNHTSFISAPFAITGTTFERRADFDAKKEMSLYPQKESLSFGDASYTGIYRFDQHIASFTNPDSKLSQNGKALLLKVPVKDLLSGTKTISNILSLQN